MLSAAPCAMIANQDGKERTGRSTAADGNAVVVLEAPPLRRCAAHGLSPFGKDVRAPARRTRRRQPSPLRRRREFRCWMQGV